MTIKLYVRVEPVDETAQISITRHREDEKDPFYSRFDVLTGIESPAIELQIGDRLEVTAEPMQMIVLDKDQNVVRLEDPNRGEFKKQREEEKKKKKEDEQELKEEQEARAKEAKRLKDEYAKEAKQTEVPVKQVPFPAPLPEEYEEKKEKEKAKKQAEAAVPMHQRGAGAESEHGVRPPRGGAADSKEVKGK